MNKKIIWGLVVIIIIVTFALASRNSTQTQVLKVDSVLSLTGPASFFGIELKNGMDLANAESKINIAYEDSQSTPAAGISAFQKLIVSGKPDIAVVMLSSVASAVTPVAIENKIPVLQTLVSASKIAAQSPYTFRYFTSGDQESPIAADIFANKLGAKNIAALYMNDEYGLSYFNALKESVEKNGGKIVAAESFTRADTDFRTRLSKINAQKPDVIYVVALDSALVTILKQARELNTKATLATNWVLANPSVHEQAKGADEGVYLTAPSYYLDPQNQVVQDFISKYATLYKKQPSAYAAIGYDIVKTLAQIKKQSGDTPEDVIRKLTDLKKINGVMGNLNIDAEGEITFALYPAMIKGGKLVEVK